MNNFDDAMRATEEMFANAEQNPQEEEVIAPEVVEEQPAETPTDPQTEVPEEQVVQQPTQEEVVLDNAVKTAEVAAQAAQERDMQLQQALQELEAIKAQNQQMQGAIQELSKKNEENLIEEALQMPTLDINGLAFADEATIANAQSEYAQKMAEFVKGDVMREVAPFVEQAKEGQRQKEQSEMLELLATLPELQGIGDMLPQMEKIIANNRWLQSDDMPVEEKLLNAFAIAKGVNNINTPPEEPKELTSEELMELYDKNPTFQELVEKKRLDTIKQSQQVPPFSASSGAVNAALNIKEKPKTFEEASRRTREMFGLD
jgi:hypothetical protein